MKFSGRPTPAVFLILLYLLGLSAYINSFNGEFLFDDINSIVIQKSITGTDGLLSVWGANKARFIPFLSYRLNYLINGLSPQGYHVFNFALHAINSILVFIFLKKLFELPALNPGNKKLWYFIPFAASALFAVHPVQTMAVNYISQRSTLFAAFFYLLTLVLYLYYKSGGTGGKLRYYILSLFTLIFALVSKENSFSLPLAILLTETVVTGTAIKSIKKITLRVLPYFIITFSVFYFFRLYGSTNITRDLASINMLENAQISRYEYILTQTNVIRKYTGLLVFPASLNVDYDFPLSKNVFEKDVILSLSFLALLIFIALRSYKKNRLLTYGIFYFFIALSVESSFIPIKDVIFEHRIYLPSVGFFIAISWVMRKFKDAKFFKPVIGAIVLILMLLTVNRNKVWRSQYALWKDTAVKSPGKARAHYNLGVASFGINRFKEASFEFTKTIEIDPSFSEAYLNLAALYESEKMPDEIPKLYEARLKTSPRDAKIRGALASYYFKKGESTRAISEYRTLLLYDSRNALAYNDLGTIFFAENNKTEALKNFHRAIELDPAYEIALFNLANTYFHYGEDSLSRVYYKKLLNLNREYLPRIPIKALESE